MRASGSLESTMLTATWFYNPSILFVGFAGGATGEALTAVVGLRAKLRP